MIVSSPVVISSQTVIAQIAHSVDAPDVEVGYHCQITKRLMAQKHWPLCSRMPYNAMPYYTATLNKRTIWLARQTLDTPLLPVLQILGL